MEVQVEEQRDYPNKEEDMVYWRLEAQEGMHCLVAGSRKNQSQEQQPDLPHFLEMGHSLV